MNALRKVLALGFWLCECANLLAGPVVLPSDISVSLTAEPNANLQSGQRVIFTISITNNGPEPIASLGLQSSPIYDELDVFSASADCDNHIVLAVVDLEDSFYFLYNWYAVWPDDPIDVGETRKCYLSLDFTPWAPSVFPLIFDMSVYDDLDPSNNSAIVFLRRPVAATEPVPMLSPTWLGLLSLLVAAIGIMANVFMSRPLLSAPRRSYAATRR